MTANANDPLINFQMLELAAKHIDDIFAVEPGATTECDHIRIGADRFLVHMSHTVEIATRLRATLLDMMLRFHETQKALESVAAASKQREDQKAIEPKTRAQELQQHIQQLIHERLFQFVKQSQEDLGIPSRDNPIP